MRLLERANRLDRRFLAKPGVTARQRERQMRLFWVAPAVSVTFAMLAVLCRISGDEVLVRYFLAMAFLIALLQGFPSGYYYALRCQRDGRTPFWERL